MNYIYVLTLVLILTGCAATPSGAGHDGALTDSEKVLVLEIGPEVYMYVYYVAEIEESGSALLVTLLDGTCILYPKHEYFSYKVLQNPLHK